MIAKFTHIALGLLVLSSWAFAQEPEAEAPKKEATPTQEATPAAAQDASHVESQPADWSLAKEGKTQHYLVYSLKDEATAKSVANSLESLYGKYKQLLKPDFESKDPFSVLIFPDLTNYNAFGEEFGGAASSTYAAYCPEDHPEQPVALLHNDNNTYLRMYAAHGATKQFLRKAFPGRVPPSWIEDGLASMFEVTLAYNWSANILKYMTENDQFIPLEQLLRAGNTDFSRQRISELGLLFYYLVYISEDTKAYIDPITNKQKQPFVEYIQKVLAGEDVSQLDVHKLLTTPERIKQLEEEFKTYKFVSQ